MGHIPPNTQNTTSQGPNSKLGNSSLRDTEFECLKDTGGEIGAPLLAWVAALRLGGGYRHDRHLPTCLISSGATSMPDFAARYGLLSVELSAAVILTVNSWRSSDFFESTSI